MRAAVFGLILALQIASAAGRGSGTISGIVIKGSSDMTQPLANARVELLDSPARQVVRTDPGGRFTFDALPPGRYRISVTRDGFIRQEYGQRIPNGPASRIELGPAQQLSDIVFLMQPAATITGWVRDEFGEVVPNVLVQAARRGYDARGKRTVIPMASTLSDDRGQYRLYWLDPGEYIVSAGSAGSQGGSIYLQTYFPGFDDPSNAEIVTLRAGREVHGVDFKVVHGSPGAVSGFVVDTNKAFAAATITLQPPGDVASSNHYSGQALGTGPSRGEFGILDVTPGTYIVSATNATAGQRYSGNTTITVRNGRFGIYNNVRITIGPAAVVEGSFIREGPSLDLSKTSAGLVSVEPVLPSPLPASVHGGHLFTLAGVLSGVYMLEVTGLPEDTYIKDAADVIEIVPGVNPGLLEVELGSPGGQIAGTVMDASGQPRFGSQIVLVPDGDRRIRPNQYRLVTSGQDGAFAIQGIPPGDYKLFAWEAIEPFAYLNADFLRSYEAQGRRVQVTAGQKTSLQVRMIADEPW